MKIYLGGSRGNWRENLKNHLKAEDPTIEFLEPFKVSKLALMDYTRDDLDAIKESDLVFFHINYHIYTGGCLEAGYAYALKKPIILVFNHAGYIDPMLLAVSRKVFTDIESAIKWFKGYIKRMN